LLFLLVHDYIPKNNWILIITDLTLLLLALAVAGLVIRTALRLYRERRAPIKATAHPTCG